MPFEVFLNLTIFLYNFGIIAFKTPTVVATTNAFLGVTIGALFPNSVEVVVLVVLLVVFSLESEGRFS